MRQTMMALVVGLAAMAATGCSAAKAAMGVLAPKPAQVTVVNNVAVPPPAPITVTVQQAKPKAGRLTAIAVGGAAGVVAGGLLGAVLDHRVATAAAIGGGVGALTGLVVHELD